MIKRITTNDGIDELVMPRTYFGYVTATSGSRMYATVLYIPTNYAPEDGDQLTLYFDVPFVADSSSRLRVNSSSDISVEINKRGFPGDRFRDENGNMVVYYDSTSLNSIHIRPNSCIMFIYNKADNKWYMLNNDAQFAGRFFEVTYSQEDFLNTESGIASLDAENNLPSLEGLSTNYVYAVVPVKIEGAVCLGLTGWSSSTRYVKPYTCTLVRDSNGDPEFHIGIAVTAASEPELGSAHFFTFNVGYLSTI